MLKVLKYGKYRVTVPLALIYLFVNACCVCWADFVVPDDYSTIQQAIDAAKSGDTIHIKPGIYNENIIFKSGITLKGDSEGQVKVCYDLRISPVISVVNCSDGTISGLSLSRNQSYQPTEEEAYSRPAVFINSSSITVTDSEITDGGGNGISILGKSNCSISDCTVKNNANSGIVVKGNNSVAELMNNTCSGNGGSGIYFIEGASGTAVKNVCTKNRYGIIVWGEGTDPELRNNTCDKNKDSGIFIGGSATGKVEQNICKQNDTHGICIMDGLSSPRVFYNQLTDNKRMGLYSPEYCNAKSYGNIFERNGEISFLQIRHLFFDKDFDALEEMVDRIRKEDAGAADRQGQLDYFYSSIALRLDEFESLRKKAMENLEAWSSERPQSVTPLIIKSKAYIKMAWRHRSGNFAPEVTAKGWQGFYENLETARSALVEAEKKDANDPQLYADFLTVGMGLSFSREHMYNLLEKGVSIEPNYYPLYCNMAISLLPRWGGEPGEVESFASTRAAHSKNQPPEILYARIATHVLVYGGWKTFLNYNFDYPKIKKGHEHILKQYPEYSYFLNSYCLFACIYEDKETARKLFEKIGDNWDWHIWSTIDNFKNYKILANKE